MAGLQTLLPPEVLAHVALYVGKKYHPVRPYLTDLLALRCACKAGKKAVERAAREHKAVEVIGFRDGASAQAIQTFGRYFGSGCRTLDLGFGSKHMLAIRDFVVSDTRGQLRELRIKFSGSTLSRDVLMEMCRGCRQLRVFDASSDAPCLNGPTKGANLADFASELSRACPLLEDVRLRSNLLSAAETYAMHFPRLKCLSFRAQDPEGYEPTCYDQIEVTLRTCAHVDHVWLTDCIVSPALVDLLLRSPIRGRLRKLVVRGYAEISPELILQCARGFETMTVLYLPDGEVFSAEPEFYHDLAQARPTIKAFDPGWGSEIDDAGLRFMCEGCRLEELVLSSTENLSSDAIEAILQTPTAQTLRKLYFYGNHQFASAAMLRLFRGCPQLADFVWETDDDDSCPIEDGPHDEILRLIKSRGGKRRKWFKPWVE